MAAKPSQPALYEKMRSREIPSAPVSTKVDISPAAPARESSDSWLSPGRAIRLPVGHVLLVCGVTLVLLIATYMFGVRRGAALERTGLDQQIINNASPAITDPLDQLQPVVQTSPGRSALTTSPPANRTMASNAPASWGPVVPAKDPRQKGLNYFILAETNESGARLLAEFCRSQGLETYVLSGKNDRLRKVVAFPGFEASARSSPQVKQLESLIHAVGDRWKKNKGATDLSDAYASLYGG